MSRGKSAARPRAVRDSEAIQATTARKAWDQPLPPPSLSLSPASLQDKRDKGGPTFGNRGCAALAGTLARLNLVKNICNRRRSRRKVGGPEQRRDREVPSLNKTRQSSAGRRPSSSRRQEARRETKGRFWTTRIRGPRREKEARLLDLRRDRSELRHSGAHHVTNGVVTQNLVAAVTAGEGMVSPMVQYLTTHGASRVMIPKEHAEAALQGSTKEGRRDMGISGRRTCGKPGPSARDAASVEVQAAMTREGRVSENARHGSGLDFARQRLLRRGITLRMNVGTGRDDAPEGALGSGKVALVVKVEGVKVRPEEAAQIAPPVHVQQHSWHPIHLPRCLETPGASRRPRGGAQSDDRAERFSLSAEWRLMR